MHSEGRAFFFIIWEEFPALYGRGHNVGNAGSFLWEIGGEVHFLPIHSVFEKEDIEIFYHLKRFLMSTLGNPKSDPTESPSTK